MDTVSTIFTLKTLATFLIAVLPVSAKTNSGEQIEGNLAGFAVDAIKIVIDGRTTEIPFDELSSLTPTSASSGTGPTYRVTLAGGSRIAAQNIALSDSELVVEPRRQAALRIPIKQVKAIRFRAANSATDPKWLGIVSKESRGDALVIRRSDNRLDQQNGIINGIADGKVSFDLDGDVVDAPIEKLEGVVFGATDSESHDVNIRVSDIYESQWMVKSIATSSENEPLNMQISDSLSHTLPIDQIASIRWIGGMVFLAEQSPASNTTKPYFQTNVSNGLLDKFFAAREVGGQDLVASGGSSIEYRIDPGYQTFAGSVHRANSIRTGSKLKLMILLDGESRWEQELIDSEPRGFELPVGDARRVAIIVDNGDDGDLGDTVRIVRPRLTK